MATVEGQRLASMRSLEGTAEATKRKHVSDTVLSNGNGTSPTSQDQRDMLDVLRSRDTNRSFLEYKFLEHIQTEPAHKRAKLSSSGSQISIADKLARARYHALNEITQDAQRVCDLIIDSIRNKKKQGDDENNRPSIDDLKQIQHTKAIRHTIMSLVDWEISRRAHNETALKQEADVDDKSMVNAELKNTGTILTLFGNAPTPKQLFSSLQNASGTSEGPLLENGLSIEEMSLPNGLFATKIKPSLTTTTEKASTFAEAFPPPQTLPLLSAPKAYKRSNTRDNAVTWEFKDSSRGSKRGGYTTQVLTVADWLSYGGAETLSPREKRKQRERALSGSGSDAQAPSEMTDPALEAEKQEEALFRQAYSSYAPAYDNSRSVVDASLKNLVWWHKIGNKKYNSRFSLDPALREHDAAVLSRALPIFEDEHFNDSGFAKAVEEYTDDDDAVDEPVNDMTDVEEVLKKITDLLETLASHQYIRTASTPTSTLASKVPISPAPTLSTTPSKPDVPSADETDVYHSLQREIAYLVLQLPPYAVAKLNGDQLAELGVSRIIKFESGNYRGQMEEDQAARLAKHTAAAAAAGIASLARSSSSLNPHYSSTSRTPAIGQSANTRYGQSATYGVRTPATAPTAQRPISGQGSYGTPIASARSQLASSAQYARSGATQQQTYGQSNGQQARPSLLSGFNHGSGNASAQRAAQAVPQFQPRSHMAAANAVNYQTASYQAPSPAKSTGPQPGSGRATPLNYASPVQTPVNGLPPARAPPPLIPRATSGTPQPQNGGPTQNTVNGHV